MFFMTKIFLDGLAKLQLVNLGLGTNHDVYDKRLTLPHPWDPFKNPPRHVYFYYLKVNEAGDLVIDHHEYDNGADPNNPVRHQPIPHSAIPAIAEHLTGVARATTSVDHDFKDVYWKRLSYIVIVIDEPKWKFQKRLDGKSAIAFNPFKNGSRPNCSFFDAADFDFESTEIDNNNNTIRYRSSGVYFVNHMKVDSQGTTIASERDQRFEFDMYFDVEYASGSSEKMAVILDPGGTNQGPPEQPYP